MPELFLDVDAALTEVPVNSMPLIDDTDFKSIEASQAYNAAGMALKWNFVTSGGVFTQTAVTPTTAGDYDWVNQTNGMYSIEIPASGGASINNDTEGYGWFTGFITGVLPWRGPIIGFRASGLNDLLLDSAYSATRGLVGTALPAAAADAAGGVPISDAGGLDLDNILAKVLHNHYLGPLGYGVHINSTASNTNTVVGVDGTHGNPVSSLAAAKTLATSIGVTVYYVSGDSDFTVDATYVDWTWYGFGELTHNTINLGSQDVGGNVFYNLALEGTQGGSTRIQATQCALKDPGDRKSTRLNSSHQIISYAVFCLKKKKN